MLPRPFLRLARTLQKRFATPFGDFDNISSRVFLERGDRSLTVAALHATGGGGDRSLTVAALQGTGGDKRGVYAASSSEITWHSGVFEAGSASGTVKRRKRRAPFAPRRLLAFAGGLLAVLVSGCGRQAAQQIQPPPSVSVSVVDQKEIVEWDEFTGRTEPVESVEVRPRVSGYIQEVRFQSGQLVKKGNVLFVIDPRWHQAEFDRREAEAERARVQSENARREAERTTQLLASKAVSSEDADARVARFHESKAALLAAEAMRDSAKLDLDYTQVRAPIDGRVSRALLTEGNYVSGVSGTTTLLTTIVSVNPIYVYADVDEDTLLKFNALARAKKLETNACGKVPVELQLADEPGFLHQGHIESFDNRLDANTGSILLRAVFPNEEGHIVPGLFARIRVPLSERHPVLLVTERAIGTDQAQKYVFTLTATNTVEYRAVKLGPFVDGQRIVRSGLQAGDKIVVNGLQRVRPGMPVAPQQELAGKDAVTVARQ